MKHTSRSALLAIVLVTSAGCGSATTSLISDGLNVINEVSDSLRKIVDEESADRFVSAGKAEVLKNRWEAYQKRVEKWVKDKEAADLQEASWFLNVDLMMEKTNKRKGAIGHILGQRSGDLDKHFGVWLSKNGIPVDRNTDMEAVKVKAAPLLEKQFKSAEAWFKESDACMKNLQDAKTRLTATARKVNSAKLKEVATSWETFLQ